MSNDLSANTHGTGRELFGLFRAHASTAEEADLTTPSVGSEKVDDLDALKFHDDLSSTASLSAPTTNT